MVVPVNARRQHHLRPSAGAWRQAWLAASLLLAGQMIRAEDDTVVDEIDPMLQQRQQQQMSNTYDLGENFDVNVVQGGEGFQLRAVGQPGLPAGQRVGAENGVAGARAQEATAVACARRLGDARLARIDTICGLTDAQRRKLRLAMDSDVRRAVEEIGAVRTQYAGVQVNFAGPDGQRKWQQLQQDVQRCRRLFDGLCDAESLFGKSLPTILDAEQYARLTAEDATRRTYLWRAIVARSLRTWDESLGLDQRQYDEIEKLLLEREPPLRVHGRFQRAELGAMPMLVLVVLADIDANRLKAAVSERQWRVLAVQANQGNAMRSHIEAQGLLEKVAK